MAPIIVAANAPLITVARKLSSRGIDERSADEGFDPRRVVEWRDGKIMDDEQIEKYWQFCERKSQHPVIKYDILMGWALAGLGCGAFWAFVWMFIR